MTSAIVGGLMAIAGACGYTFTQADGVTAHEHARTLQDIAQIEQRLERVEGRTVRALESIDKRLTAMEIRR